MSVSRWDQRREFFRDARRARYLARLTGKAADLIIAMALWQIPGAAGVFAALYYVLMCDAFPGGRSAGSGGHGQEEIPAGPAARANIEAVEYAGRHRQHAGA